MQNLQESLQDDTAVVAACGCAFLHVIIQLAVDDVAGAASPGCMLPCELAASNSICCHNDMKDLYTCLAYEAACLLSTAST
jgi:hypothetical protein